MKTAIFNPIARAARRLLPLGVLAVVALLTACSDDDNGSGAPLAINKVYLEDVNAPDSVYDREVTFARLGQLIRIEGSGFTGLKKIYINGYDTYFNNALLTDNNVWVTLNAKTPVDKAEESVRNTITLVKDNGQLTLQLHRACRLAQRDECRQHAAAARRDGDRLRCQPAGDLQGHAARRH
jgi:hypothetical protein